MLKHFLMLSMLLFSCAILYAQETPASEEPQLDIVYLKNGSVFRGKIVSYEQGGVLKFAMMKGRNIFKFNDDEIEKIIQGTAADNKVKVKGIRDKTYRFRERGVYYTAALGFPGGRNTTWGDFELGLSIQMSAGLQFNRFVGAGIGFGSDFYYVGSGEMVLPVFAEVRGYWLKRNVTPFYNLAVGHGFGIKNDQNGIVKAEGGLMFNPSVGIRFGGSDMSNFTLEFGYKRQKARQYRGSIEFPWIMEFVYHRYMLRFGVLF